MGEHSVQKWKIYKMEVLELKSTIPEIANPLNMGLRANGVGEESVDVNI